MLLPPTLPDTSPLANVLALKRDLLGFFTRLAREAGSFAHYTTGPGNVFYFVNDPAPIREVLVRQEDAFRKWSLSDTYHLVLGRSVVTSDEPLHRKLQAVERPAFHQNRMPEYARLMVEAATERQTAWDEGEMEVEREMHALALEVAAQTFFSTSVAEGLDAHLDAAAAIRRLSGQFGSSGQEDDAFLEANGHFVAFARELLDRRRQDGGSDADLLALLLHAQLRDGETMTDAQIVDEIRAFLLAGHLTTATVMAGTLWLLSRDLETQAALHRELDAVLGGRAPTLADVPALGWCERVFLEALRLFPPVWVLHREAVRPVRLGGYDLPAGAKLLIIPWTLHRVPEIFPEPERFLPARWENDARSRLPRGAFLTFAAGSRSCMGERFAMVEGVLLLATLLQRWRFEPSPRQQELVWYPHIVLWPRRGVLLRATQRGPSPSPDLAAA